MNKAQSTKHKAQMIPHFFRGGFFMLCALCFVLCDLSASAQDCNISGIEKDASKLCGFAKQGGIIWGTGDSVFYNGKKVSLNNEFVIALPYNAPDTIKITFGKKTFSYLIARQKFGSQTVSNIPKNMAEPPKEVQARIDSESAEIKKVRDAALNDTLTAFKNLVLPANLKNFPPDKNTYGFSRTYNGKMSGSPHKGTDFPAPAGTPVYSFGRGKVILAASHYLNGNIVIVSHGHGITAHYLHLSEINVKVGDIIDENTIIGKVGNTGKSSGAHLHFQINLGSIFLDPALLVKGLKIK